MVKIKDVVVLRDYNSDTDKDFLYATWLRRYKDHSYFAKRIKYQTFFKEHHKIIDHILAKPNTKVIMAVPKDFDDVIAGYIVFESHDKPTVHFVYIKDVYQGMGVAKHLFEENGIDPNNITITHWTYCVNQFAEKYPGITYNPYAL